MQKVIDFLEQNCQWLAIGLGAFFVLFMTYTYVLQPPAKVVIGSQTFTAGELDSDTLENVAKSIQALISSSDKIPLPPPPQFVEGFRNAMNWTGVAPASLANGWPVLPPLSDTPTVPTVVDPKNPNAVASSQPDATKVTALPVLPKAIPAESKFGRSVVIAPGPDGQPVQPAAGAPPVLPGQPPAGAVDKDWLTQLFHINIAQIDAAFKQANIPVQFYSTIFLQVEMQREELDDSGNPVPGTETVIPPLNVWRNPTAPPPPFPADDTTRDVQSAYLTWAAANGPDILEPLFYQWVKGDQWTKPGAVGQQQAIFDAQQYLTGAIPAWVTPEQKAAIFKARQDAAKAREEQRKVAHPRPAPTPRSAPSGPGAGGAPAGLGMAPAPSKDIYLAVAPGSRPPARPPVRANPAGEGDPVGASMDRGRPGAGAPGMEGIYGSAGAPGVGVPTPANLPVAGTDYPSADFSPADPKWATKTIDGWCHDETVVANKTYRYRIRYKMKSPVWAAGNVTDPATLSDKFAIVSDWSDWSSPVMIPPLINFFVKASKSPNGNAVAFDVYRWDKGGQRNESFSVSEGDEVGGMKNGIDFSTGWTVVDFRKDPRQNEEWQILLVNDKSGRLVTRSYGGDKDDALYKALKEQVAAAKATETAAAGVAGGGAVGVPGGAAGGGAPAIR